MTADSLPRLNTEEFFCNSPLTLLKNAPPSFIEVLSANIDTPYWLSKSFASRGLINNALSQVSFVIGSGHSIIHPLLAYRPSNEWKLGTKRSSKLESPRFTEFVGICFSN